MLRVAARFPMRAAAGLAGAAIVSTSSLSAPTHSASWFGSKDTYHIRYFDARGAAETARLLMKLAGQDFTDDRWPLDFSKPRSAMSPGMTEARTAGLLSANLDRAPVLLVNGEHAIGQSKSIERFLSKRLGLLGSSDIEAAQIDSFTEHVRDLKDQYSKAKATLGEEAKREALATFFSSTMPQFCAKMEACVARHGGLASVQGPLVGKALSLADVTLFVLVNEYFDNKQGAKAALIGCPRLQASVAAIGSHPNIASYLETRPASIV